MFQYTTETILNTNEGGLCYKNGHENKRVLAIHMANDSNTGTSTNPDTLLIDGVGLYKKEFINAVYRTAYKDDVRETLTVKMPAADTKDEKVYRLMITTSQEGITSPIYADAQLRHKKPFFYEIIVPANMTEQNIAEKFIKSITNEMAQTDFNFFTAALSGTDSITLTADDCYTRFQTIQIASIERQNNNYTGFEDYKVLVDWKRADGTNASVTAFKAGTEGAGTVARLIKNLRVPTDANTDPFAADNGGRPIPGGKYNQYTIEYITNRRHIGGQVMGALDKSITTHVFFVESGMVTEFEKAIDDVTGGTIATADYDPNGDAHVGSKQ